MQTINTHFIETYSGENAIYTDANIRFYNEIIARKVSKLLDGEILVSIIKLPFEKRNEKIKEYLET